MEIIMREIEYQIKHPLKDLIESQKSVNYMINNFQKEQNNYLDTYSDKNFYQLVIGIGFPLFIFFTCNSWHGIKLDVSSFFFNLLPIFMVCMFFALAINVIKRFTVKNKTLLNTLIKFNQQKEDIQLQILESLKTKQTRFNLLLYIDSLTDKMKDEYFNEFIRQFKTIIQSHRNALENDYITDDIELTFQEML